MKKMAVIAALALALFTGTAAIVSIEDSAAPAYAGPQL